MYYGFSQMRRVYLSYLLRRYALTAMLPPKQSAIRRIFGADAE